MSDRASIVLFRSRDRIPSQRLRDQCDGYRVATDALLLAADLGCSGDIYDGLWAIVEREAAAFENCTVKPR